MNSPSAVRLPRHAGVFYPADKEVLLQQLDDYLSDSDTSAVEQIKAIIAPHAGYDYSGHVAGMAYAALQAREDIRRIVILAPNHQTAESGALVSSHEAWRTPLGEVKVDQAFIARHWAGLPQVKIDNEVFQAEYSIEVQVPFIQRVLPGIPIVPMLPGACESDEIREILQPVWDCEQTLIVISSDLYHYLPRDKAIRAGMRIAGLIEQNNYTNITAESACGYVGLRGVMELAGAGSYFWRTLCVKNSGFNNRFNLTELVGYGAFLLLKKNRLSL